ncbi:MAG TPA: diacylglycerol kinase family protein [Candidatus Binatia bacterium]|nr:diacylglycerol kinase family protein [Candidatus Binatia bacterium]
MGGIAVILNPHAGGNRRVIARARPERLSRIVGEHGSVHCPDSLDALEQTIARALEDQPDVLALCGGDGSYFRAFSVLNRLLASDPWPPILPLPAGTINNLTHAIQSRSRSPESLLGEVVHELVHGIAHETADCDLFCVGEGDVGYIFGIGMIVNFLRAYYATPDPRPASAAWLVFRLAMSAAMRGALSQKIFQPFEADIVCDGERVPHRSYRMLIASSVAAIGLGFVPFYLAGKKPGQFHVLGGPAKGSRLARRLPRFYRGFPAQDPELYDNIGSELLVEFARPAYYTVNGDLLGPTMRIAVRKLRRITVIRG